MKGGPVVATWSRGFLQQSWEGSGESMASPGRLQEGESWQAHTLEQGVSWMKRTLKEWFQ